MRICLAAVALAALVWPPRAAAQTAADFFNDEALHEIRLSINPADWARLRANFRENTYYECTFQWRNVTVDSIGIRSSGLGSRNPQKPNLRVDFDRFETKQQFLGLKSVKLDANTQDSSQIRERVTMAFFARLGLPASRETHTRLFVNDQLIGLYAVVEAVDKDFLQRNYNQNDGYLYEYNWNFDWRFQHLGTDLTKYSPILFDPKTHEKDPNPAPIEAFVRAANQASDADFAREVGQYIDLQKFLTHVAGETVMAEVDGILGRFGMANFYLYRFERMNLHQFIVWDKDNTFSDPLKDIFQNANEHVLMRRALAAPGMRDFYLAELVRAASTAGGPGGFLEQQVNRVHNQIRSAALADPNKQCPVEEFVPGGALRPCTNDDFERGTAHLRSFVQQRSEFVIGAAFAAGFTPSGLVPRLSTGGAVNAAGNVPPISPGSLASVYGQDLGAQTAQATSLPLPTAIGGLSILVNGVPAPLLFVSPGQVNIQVPWDTAAGTASIRGDISGVPGNTITAQVRSAAPGVFVTVFADGRVVSAERPATAGDVLVIYATGVGPVTNNVGSGVPAPSNPLAASRDPVTVRFGEVTAQEVFFAGLTPGFVGLWQINVRVPAGVPAGPRTPLTLSVGGQTSAPATIATR